MSELDAKYAELDRQEEIIARVRPRLDELRLLIGPWLRDVASGRPSIEPTELRAEEARLQSELWQTRHINMLRAETGALENRSRRLQEEIAALDAELARLAAPAPTPERAALNADSVKRLAHYRDDYAQRLERIGIPRTVAVEAV